MPDGPAPPSRIGRYEILLRLGQGGMATVYLARATGSAGFEKLVALKVIHPHLVTDPRSNFVGMFLDEARIAAQIHHPHVVEILDLGEDQGYHFMVLEFVEGETLAALLRALHDTGGRLPPPVILQLMIDACAGLQAAHELCDGDGNPLGVIHRDVSPHNLLIDLSGWVRLVDFGIMKAKGKQADTRTGQILGKIPYMSPEQAQARPLTPASDLFALGALLWELCAGERLFAGGSEVELLAKVIAGERRPLGSREPPLPPEFEAGVAPILDRALARDPRDRYATAAAMAYELRQLLRTLAPAEEEEDEEPRVRLAAIMREHFGAQVEYRRALLRASRSGSSQSGRLPVSGVSDTLLMAGHAVTPTGSAPGAAAGPKGPDGSADSDDFADAVATRPLSPLGLLESAAAGTAVVAKVAVEPEAALARETAATTEAGAARAPPQRRLLLGVVAATAAVAGLALYGSIRGLDGAGGRRASAISAASEETSQAAFDSRDPGDAEPAAIRWMINSDPDGALVRISGASSPELQAAIDEQLAGQRTPLSVTLPRSDEEALTLEVYMAGYQAASERRLPLATDNLRYVLRPVADLGSGAQAPPTETTAKTGGLRLSARTKGRPAASKDAVTEPREGERPEVGDDLPPAPSFDKPLKLKKRPERGDP